MSILSNNFYYQPLKIDSINTKVYGDFIAKEGDANGRGLLVTLTENGLQKDTTGITLNLKWAHTTVSGLQNLDPFEAVDLTKGLYKITYPTDMLRKGKVDAFIQIIDSGKLIGSRNIKINVEATVGDDTAIESSNEFRALASALVEVNGWNDRIGAVEADFIQRANDMEATYPQELLSLGSQLAQITTHPMKYGALGNGQGNDTTPFQNALDNATEGGIVDLEGKHYAITGVKINKKLHLKNGKITLINSAIQSAIEVANTVTGAKVSDLDIYIDNVSIVGDNLSGIFVNGSTNTTIQNVYVKGSKNIDYSSPYMHSSIYAHEANKVTIINCVVENSHREGIMTRLSNDVYIYQCKAYNCGYSGIGTSGGERAIVESCISFGSGKSNITVNSKDSIVTGCMVKDNAENNGITVGHNHEVEQYALNCIVSNNLVINSTDNGIVVTYPQDCTVTGNTITDCEGTGLLITPLINSENNININGNSINRAKNGIYMFGNTNALVNVSDNNIDNCPVFGLNVNIYGHVTINGNVIRNSGGNTVAGYYSGSTIYGNLETVIFSENQVIDTPAVALSLFNIKDAKISGNLFKNINTTNNQFGGCIIINAKVGTVNGIIPNTIIDGNTLVGGLGSTFFAKFEKDLIDSGVKNFIIKGNSLLDISSSNLLSNADPNNTLTLWNNKVGKDKSGITVTLPTGQTSVTVSNSNWHGSNMLPIITPRNGTHYEAKPRITTITNASITITYEDIASPVEIGLTYL